MKTTLSPDYQELRDSMRERFALTEAQATDVAHWLETEYDTDANSALELKYFEALIEQPIKAERKVSH